jgi:DNA-binding XRE family transcriptional regulator
VVILEVFGKKTRTTPRDVIDRCRRRLRSTMRENKKRNLRTRGWKVGSAKDFLRLTDQEAAYIELKLRLASSLRDLRRRRRLTQMDLARFLHSSQSRIAKMETGHPSVSLDLLVRSHLALGTSTRQLSRIISTRSPASAA